MTLNFVAPPALYRRVSCMALAALVIAGAGCRSGSAVAADGAAASQQAQPAPTTTPSPVPVAVPVSSKTIYSDASDAKADIAAAEVAATRYHRNILLDFGGNWCGDCQVLDIYMHQTPNQELIAKDFVVVHVDIGRYDKNLDVAAKYGIPLKRGVPALAVLNSRGKLLYSQKTGEFENMRTMDSASVTAFLDKWKPAM